MGLSLIHTDALKSIASGDQDGVEEHVSRSEFIPMTMALLSSIKTVVEKVEGMLGMEIPTATSEFHLRPDLPPDPKLN